MPRRLWTGYAAGLREWACFPRRATVPWLSVTNVTRSPRRSQGDEEAPHPVRELACREDDGRVRTGDPVRKHGVSLRRLLRMRDGDVVIGRNPLGRPRVDSAYISRLSLETDADEAPPFVDVLHRHILPQGAESHSAAGSLSVRQCHPVDWIGC